MPERLASLDSAFIESDLLVLHARLHCEDAHWRASLLRSLDAFPGMLQERVLRQCRVSDRCARILDKWLLLRALASLGFSGATLNSLQYDSFGRPSMAGAADLDFSLSHASDLAVCAVTRRGRVGIDVEQLRAVRSEDFRDVFGSGARLRLRSEQWSQQSFFREWTQLEAVLKADGCGMSELLNTVEGDGRSASFAGRRWFLHEVPIGSGYACHVACEFEHPQLVLRSCRWEEGQLWSA